MSKEQTWKSPIVTGVAGATVGAILGAAYGESIGALELAVIGGALGTLAGYLQEATKRWQKLKFPTGREVDLYLNALPLIEKYIKDKVDRGLKVEGNLHFLPNKEFEAYAFEYFLRRFAQGAKMPQGKEPLKAPESDLMAQARESAQRTNAYQTNGQIFINLSRAEAGTVIHESLHLFQEISYLREMDPDINEGTTEYFTRLICAQHNITRSQKYSVQYECIKKLVTVCGEDKLAEAYFKGNILALEMAVDASKQLGTFQMWKDFMIEREFENANNLL